MPMVRCLLLNTVNMAALYLHSI